MALQGEVVNEPDEHVEFVKGKMGTDLPVIDGFLFQQKDSTHTRFYCRTRTCRATMKLVAGPDGTSRADRTPTHDHPNHTEYIAALRHIQRLREAAVNTHNKHVPSVKVCSAVRLETRTTRRRSVDNRPVRRCHKRRNAQRTPNEIETFPFLEKNAIYVKNDRSIIVFGSDWGVRVASTVRRICVDGTFRAAPATHYQLLIFHAICSNGSSIPILHALMTNKRYESYLVVLEQIEARERALNVRPHLRRAPTCSRPPRRSACSAPPPSARRSPVRPASPPSKPAPTSSSTPTRRPLSLFDSHYPADHACVSSLARRTETLQQHEDACDERRTAF